MHMRYSVRAVIVQDGKVILIKRTKEGQPVYYCFPGGGIEESDASAETALIRECQEELGVVVRVGHEIYRHAFNGAPDVFYRCDIVSGLIQKKIGGPEAERPDIYGAYEVMWVDLEKISQLNIQPPEMKEVIQYKL